MSPSTTLDLRFCRFFACHDSEEISAGDPPLFLAANGVHGVVNVDYRDASQASYSTDVIKVCLYGMCIRVFPTEEAY